MMADEQVEAGGAIGLVLEPPITQFAELVEEERACERVAGLALVEARLGTPAQINVAQPVEHEDRSEEHTSELQSLMRISYAVFCLKKKKINIYINIIYRSTPLY